MRKLGFIFTGAVFLPSLVLGWLALRSARDQVYVLERQQAAVYSAVAESVVTEINTYLAELQRSFRLDVDWLLLRSEPGVLVREFDERLQQRSTLVEVGFAVDLQGEVLSPTLSSRVEARRFLMQNDGFLANREVTDVYLNAIADGEGGLTAAPAGVGTAERQVDDSSRQFMRQRYGLNLKQQQAVRTLQPQQLAREPEVKAAVPTPSRMMVTSVEFRALVGEATQGSVARFVNNRLNLLFWYRPDSTSPVVFGGLIDLKRLGEALGPLIRDHARVVAEDVCVALLDDSTRAVALSLEGFTANWRRPFVAAEIGEALPHWEIGVYLRNPDHLHQLARTTTLTLGALVLVLVGAIGLGGWLVVRDLRREMEQARRKTDFVSNVSHELKTPLTSIRMFAELLAEGRVNDKGKERDYLGIITAEAARLTRLINNVLDFAQIERGERRYELAPVDLVEVVHDTVGPLRPHLETKGFSMEVDVPEEPLMVRGDADALAQVLTNLLSNAEKYSTEKREIRVEVIRREVVSPLAEVRVMDRGIGVPKGCEKKIFDRFYRAHDTMNSGIQGSGLGLTLARRIARAHGGEVLHERRAGGGSCFALRLPL